nr:hypothetical protein [Baekduia sp.]
MEHPVDRLREAVGSAASSLAGDSAPGPSALALDRPKNPDHGDYATNVAMLIAGGLRLPPRDVAGGIAGNLRTSLGADLEGIDVAGPGFLNIKLSDDWYRRALAHVVAAGRNYGSGGAARQEMINVEFVSANPTDMLTIGSARNGAYGDSLARLFAFQGHRV